MEDGLGVGHEVGGGDAGEAAAAGAEPGLGVGDGLEAGVARERGGDEEEGPAGAGRLLGEEAADRDVGGDRAQRRVRPGDEGEARRGEDEVVGRAGLEEVEAGGADVVEQGAEAAPEAIGVGGRGAGVAVEQVVAVLADAAAGAIRSAEVGAQAPRAAGGDREGLGAGPQPAATASARRRRARRRRLSLMGRPRGCGAGDGRARRRPR